MRSKRWRGLLIAVGILAAVAASVAWQRAQLLTALGRFLVVADPLHAADAIVVLSGSIPDRVLEAVDLYQAGYAPRIVLTREGRPPGYDALLARGGSLPERHEENRRIALELGVPAEAVEVPERRANSTLAEAQALVAFLRERGFRRILLVTSRSHARRARAVFSAIAAGQPEVWVVPSRYDPFRPQDWWQNRALARRLVTEYGKLLTWWTIDQWRFRWERR